MSEKPAVRQIVVGVDGSPESRAAQDWAVREALLRNSPLHLTHVFTWPVTSVPSLTGRVDTGQRHAATTLLTEALEHVNALEPTLEVSTSLRIGRPASSLIGLGRDASLIVVGHRGHGGFHGLALGSVAVQVSAHASCPVAVVRPAAMDGGGPVIVGVDVMGGSEAALTFAFEEATARGCGLTAIHAWTVPYMTGRDFPATYDVPAIRAAEERLLDEVLVSWREKYAEVDVRPVTVHGSAPKALIDATAGAQLAVVGSRGHGGFAGLLIGSVSQSLLHHASCPVVVARDIAVPVTAAREERGDA